MEKNKKVINEQYIKKKGEENQCNKIMTIIGVALMMIMFFFFSCKPYFVNFYWYFLYFKWFSHIKKTKRYRQ